MSNFTVTSKDGTLIGGISSGSGPGVVLVQGAMGTAEHFSMLASALSKTFTVFVPDRRGRGRSPLAFTTEHSIERDVEDLEAVLAHSQAQRVFALSSGAVIALTAAAKPGTAITKLIAFEPPLYTRRPLPTGQLRRFESAIARGDHAAALTAAGNAVGLMPAMKFIPDFLLTFIVNRVIASDARKPKTEPSLPEIALTLQYDFKVVAQMAGHPEAWKGIGAEVMLMGGAKSPRYLREDLDSLQTVLPRAQRVTLEGLDHSASWDPHPQRNPRGNPAKVAELVGRFFQLP